MVRRVPPDAHAAEIVEEVARRAATAATDDEPPGIADFVRHYYANVALVDLRERSIDFLVGAARSHWKLARSRPPGTASVRVFVPARARDGWESTHTIVEIVTADMPFIVDSVTMALDRQGLGVHLVVHPIINVVRDDAGNLQHLAVEGQRDGVTVESFVHVEVDRDAAPDSLEHARDALLSALADVRAATSDWMMLLAQVRHVLDDMHTSPPPVGADELAEGRALLEWMTDQHFTFLGYRKYELTRENGEDALAVVPGTGLGILRNAPAVRSLSFAALPPEVRRRAREKSLLIVTKANSRSTVHRPVYLDYVGVKTFDEHGNVRGEHRFLGLWTSSAYNTSPIDVPLLRHKVQAVIDRAGFLPLSHDQKDLIAILESFPRDDLFQIDGD